VTKKRATKRPATRRVHPSIQAIIGMLERRHERGDLCQEGLERLHWWRAHGHRYKDAKRAILKWSDADIVAYADYLGLYDRGAYQAARVRVAQALDQLPANGDASVRLALERSQATLQKLIDTTVSAWVKTTTVKQWHLPENEW
jgi:hypothetical protein